MPTCLNQVVMSSNVSIIIPTHNRHKYLNRVLEYYSVADIHLFVVDSSVLEFNFSDGPNNENLHYFHLPQKTLTGKIAFALEKVTTPYVVMCADDDFIITDAILNCVDFLSKNQSFNAAMGNAIYYQKYEGFNKLNYFAIYSERHTFKTSEEDSIKRLGYFFDRYRTIFYAVHRTAILKKAFEGAEEVISNLFLNEYVTAIYPIATGHIIELPILYHVREFSDISGDKTIENIDSILFNNELKNEFEHFLNYQTEKIISSDNTDLEIIKGSLRSIFIKFAKNIYDLKNSPSISVDKKIGKFIQYLPFIGNVIIGAYRKYKNERSLSKFIKTDEEKKQLKFISELIIRTL